MNDISNFHRLVATMAPKLHVSVERREVLKTTATRSTLEQQFMVSATGEGLPQPVHVISTQSADDAAYAFSRALSQARQEYRVNQFLLALKGEWSEYERAAMRQRLLQAERHYCRVLLADYEKQDAHRYDAAMGAHYEEQGYYDDSQTGTL